MQGETTITLRGMQFHVPVGTLAHEGEFAQPLEVDVSVQRDSSNTVLDYRELYSLTSRVLAQRPLRFLEDIAVAIADGALVLDGVHAVRVAIRKPHVPIGGPLEHAEVVIARQR